MEFLVLNEAGIRVGTAEVGKITPETAAFKKVIARIEKRGAQVMIGDSDEDTAWDGFKSIGRDDPKFFDSLVTELRNRGYRFIEEEEPGD